MIAALLFLAAYLPIDLINESYEVPAHDWRYVPRPLVQEPVEVDCVFTAETRDAQARVALVSGEDLSAWRAGHEHDELATTAVGARGALRVLVHDSDTYVAIENRGQQPVRVHLRAFAEQPYVRYLSRQRKLAVILISFGVFFAIVTLSARRFLRGMRSPSDSESNR
jgi:hypothetical protein